MELSTFRPLVLFGLLMGITMVATTLGALLILPSAIKFSKISLKQTAISPRRRLKIDFLEAPALIKRKETDAKSWEVL